MTKKSDAPAIRFKGFSDAWEQRKFEEIAVRSSVICSDDTLPRVEYEDIVSGTGRLNKDIYAKQSSKSGIVFHQGDVLYGKLRPYLQNWLLPTFDGLAVGDFWVLQPQNADSSFLYRLIQSRQFDEVANQSTGTKMPRADWKLVSKTVFSIPSNISEQAAIGTYFTALDSLITLHQRKFEKLTNVKKTMLEKMFPQNGSSYPEIRFKGFTDPWEQRKFSELVQIERGGSPRPIGDFITDAPNGLNWVKIGDAPTQGNYITKTAEKIRPEGLSKTREVHPGDLILSNSMSFGKPYIMGIDGCIHDGWLLIRNTYGVFDLTFLCHLLGTPQMLSQYRSLAAGSTVNNLNKELVGNTYVTIPSITEQRVLGAYLEQLDNLITLHQRKCALLFSPFQSFISMMFTTSTFSWEQRKVGNLLIERNQQAPMSDEYPLMAFIANEGVAPKGERYDRSALVTDTVSKLYKKTEKGDFIYSSNNLETGSIGLNKYGKACISPVYSIFEPTGIADSDFLGRRLVRKDFINAMVKWRQGVIYGQWRIHESDFLKIEITVPSVEEQRKIGAYLDQLDNLITLHQRKCIFFTGRAGRLISTVNKKRITSSWEQRKLSEMCGTFEYGLNAAAKEFDGKNKYIRITDIDDASREFLLSDLSSPDICLDGMSKYLLSSGDIVFARTGASVGKTYIYRENDGIVYFAGFLIRAKVNQDNDAEFVFQSTLSPSYEKYIRITSQRSGQPGVNAQEYGEYDLFAPSKEEQQRIGHFLRGINNLITLHQRKPFLMKWRTSDANRNQTNRLVL